MCFSFMAQSSSPSLYPYPSLCVTLLLPVSPSPSLPLHIFVSLITTLSERHALLASFVRYDTSILFYLKVHLLSFYCYFLWLFFASLILLTTRYDLDVLVRFSTTHSSYTYVVLRSRFFCFTCVACTVCFAFHRRISCAKTFPRG